MTEEERTRAMLEVLYGNLVTSRKRSLPKVHLLAEHEPTNWLGLLFWLAYYVSIPVALALIWGDCQ